MCVVCNSVVVVLFFFVCFVCARKVCRVQNAKHSSVTFRAIFSQIFSIIIQFLDYLQIV